MPASFSLQRYALLALALIVLQAPHANAALISLQPDTSAVTSGSSVSLDVVVSDLGHFGAESLGAFDLFVEFDTAVLSFVGYGLGNFLGDAGLFEAIDSSTGDVGGAVNLAQVSLLSAATLDALQPGDFILATLEFATANLTAGTTTQLAIAPGAVLGNTSGAPIAVTGLASADIEIAASSIPVPGSLSLLLCSLCGALAIRRRRAA